MKVLPGLSVSGLADLLKAGSEASTVRSSLAVPELPSAGDAQAQI